MAYDAHSRLPYDSYDTQPPTIRPRLEPPCVSFSPYYSPRRVHPAYTRRPSAYGRHAPLHVSPPSYDDLMVSLTRQFHA